MSTSKSFFNVNSLGYLINLHPACLIYLDLKKNTQKSELQVMQLYMYSVLISRQASNDLSQWQCEKFLNFIAP